MENFSLLCVLETTEQNLWNFQVMLGRIWNLMQYNYVYKILLVLSQKKHLLHSEASTSLPLLQLHITSPLDCFKTSNTSHFWTKWRTRQCHIKFHQTAGLKVIKDPVQLLCEHSYLTSGSYSVSRGLMLYLVWSYHNRWHSNDNFSEPAFSRWVLKISPTGTFKCCKIIHGFLAWTVKLHDRYFITQVYSRNKAK
jgi:hypothetical protein